MTTGEAVTWWGDFTLAAAGARRWRIGPLSLFAAREGADWVIAHAAGEDPLDKSLAVAEPCDPEALDANMTRARFAFERPHERLTVGPLLADRPASVQPEAPVSVPSGESAIFYISTPVWVRLAVGPQRRFIAEVPSFRPSDTWFGRPAAGELCYAVRSRGTTRLDAQINRPHRAITPVRVINRAPEALAVERLKLPLPNLALFRSPGGGLVAPTVEFLRERSGGQAVMRIDRVERGAERLAEPRIQLRESRVLQAFEWFFAHG